MDRIEVTTVVHLPPEEVFEFLLSFQRYAEYSEYLTSVRQYGDGGTGTEYALRFEWWKIRYTARSKVTAVEAPKRIDWRLIKDLNASGQWLVEPLDADAGDDPASEADDHPRTRVTFVVEYAPGSADEGMVDLPRFVSLGWVVDRLKPIIHEEAELVVRRIVADLEGEERDVELRIETP